MESLVSPGHSQQIIAQCPKFLGTFCLLHFTSLPLKSLKLAPSSFVYYMVYNYNTKIHGLRHQNAQFLCGCVPITRACTPAVGCWEDHSAALGLNFLTHKDPGYLAQSSSKLMISLEFYLTLHNKSLNQNSKGDGFIFQYNYKE